MAEVDPSDGVPAVFAPPATESLGGSGPVHYSGQDSGERMQPQPPVDADGDGDALAVEQQQPQNGAPASAEQIDAATATAAAAAPSTPSTPSTPSKLSVAVEEPSNAMDAESLAALHRWLACICVITFDLEMGPTLEYCYPPDYLSQEEIANGQLPPLPHAIAPLALLTVESSTSALSAWHAAAFLCSDCVQCLCAICAVWLSVRFGLS